MGETITITKTKTKTETKAITKTKTITKTETKAITKTKTMLKIKRYTKKELALRYFPWASQPKVAQNHLRSWIRRCPELQEAMKGVRQLRTRYEYNEEEVALIVHYIGEPEE